MTTKSTDINPCPGLITNPLDNFPFAKAWAQESSEALSLLPAFSAQLQDRLDFLESNPTEPWALEEINELKEYNQSVGNNAALSLIEKLAHTDTYAVVTGQQPNFLVSPLYILYKALSAIAYSKALHLGTGRSVVPLFWIASDDDDFAELKQSWIITADGNLTDIGKQINRGKSNPIGTPAYFWDLKDSLNRIEQTLKTILGKSATADQIIALLTNALQLHSNFESYFAHLLTLLLGEENPLILLAPRLKSMRRRQTEILLRDLKQSGIATEAVNSKSNQLQQAGYGSLLTREPAFLNFFLIENNMRHRLVLEDGRVHAEEPKKHRRVFTYTVNELEEILVGSPEKFTPNVITRPYVQDYALPTVAYIAGPGEISYLAQVRTAATVFGIMPSATRLRTFVTISPTDASEPLVQSEKDPNSWLLAHGCSSRYLDSVAELRKQSNAILSSIATEESCKCSVVDKATQRTIEHINYGLDQYLKRIGKQLNYEGWLSLRTADHLIRPRGSSQERTLSPWNFINPARPSHFAQWLTEKVDFTRPGAFFITEWPDDSSLKSVINAYKNPQRS